ncbi:hypothetical protein m02_07310 [Bartonella bovis m02]|uniref:Uncharacterized protein n=1 Tax=Bartonella bovis m02 TaxID=1094492 RepID=N6VKI9_9HYPH|nr:hypothetical protein m02_07310 [Bartonella bovis m02]
MRVYDQLQELFAVKANGEVIAEAMRILSCGLKISQNSDEKGMSLAYGRALETVSVGSLMETVKRILRGEVKTISETFFPSTCELVRLCRDLEGSLLTTASLVRKAVLNTQAKALKEQERGENVIPFTKTG